MNIAAFTTKRESFEKCYKAFDHRLWEPKKSPVKVAFFGAHGAGETPVPIPNTEVKPGCGYNTWVLALGK